MILRVLKTTHHYIASIIGNSILFVCGLGAAFVSYILVVEKIKDVKSRRCVNNGKSC